MESLYKSSILPITLKELPCSSRQQDRSQPLHEQLVSPNTNGLRDSTSITIKMDSSDCNSNVQTESATPGTIGIKIGEEDEYSPPPPFLPTNADLVQLQTYYGILYLLYGGALVVMYPSLSQLVQVKFQNNRQSPFETLSFLTNMAVVAYAIAMPTSLILFYMRARFNKLNKKRSSTAYYVYMILKCVFCFSGILAPISLVLVLLLPSHV